MKVITVYGRTVEDAVRSGLDELGVSEDRVKVNVVEQPVKGLFGLIGAKEAKVELTLIPDPAEEAVRLLEAVTEAMDLQAEITRSDEEDHVLLSMKGPDMGMVIGRRGQTLDALQYLINVAANRHSRKYVRIVVDAEQFRSRRKQTLENLANRLASRVSRGQKEIVLEPMTPQERKIIHSCLQNHPRVKTYSKGEEPNRRVVIALK